MSAVGRSRPEGGASATAEAGTGRLVERIDALLPQTQCTRCGYPSCRDYARALAARETGANRCPPGGEATLASLAALLGVGVEPLDPACGEERPWTVARIDESACIGCTLCIRACPVDAIVGAPKRMHTVIAAECTGCELCSSPCPVDCIALVPMPVPGARRGKEVRCAPSAEEFLERWMRHRAPLARRRHERRRERLAAERAAGRGARRRRAETQRRADLAAKRAVIAAAVARVRARRTGAGGERR